MRKLKKFRRSLRRRWVAGRSKKPRVMAKIKTWCQKVLTTCMSISTREHKTFQKSLKRGGNSGKGKKKKLRTVKQTNSLLVLLVAFLTQRKDSEHAGNMRDDARSFLQCGKAVGNNLEEFNQFSWFLFVLLYFCLFGYNLDSKLRCCLVFVCPAICVLFI
uniref:uncharacterized protein LOC113474615 isoform X1 n=1 Tax=Ciona intestinalis TaxID=7719 RepID=UPI000EF45527|nr:uncharacterized protein LOC113474615 isoform X1 [Ciona intestinalis]|eukprot:XP_026692186.1 uncharacterized protein LOC113474615 isoform X1 [Ciona intestinalis]